MILQALCRYYDRLRADPDSGVAEPGFAPQNVHFAIELAPAGEVTRILDLRSRDGKRLVPRRMMLPSLGIKKASGILANFLWDNAAYTLGVDTKGKPERAQACFAAFAALARELCAGIDDPGAAALLGFLESWTPERIGELVDPVELEGVNLVFRPEGEFAFLHEHPALRRAWTEHLDAADAAPRTMCLVTGREAAPARLHPAVKGVKGGQSTGGAIVSFNLDAFESYGKTQNYNAPMSRAAAFAYTTALNHLLRYENGHKLQLGDATTVFWTERESPVEHFLAAFMGDAGPNDSAEAAEDVLALRRFLDDVRQGRLPEAVDDPDMHFYILGLSPNAARISVRFWNVDTVAGFLDKLGAHFRAMELVKQFPNDWDYPPLWLLLRTIAAQGKDDNVPAPVAAGLMRAVLTGADYPRALFAALLMRIRADKNVNYLRAALLKACLVRNHHMEVTVALDKDRKDEAYLLGRLFAVLEKAQEEALPGTNATIKDRYLGAASATPARVFPLLLKNSANHLAKLRKSGEQARRARSFEIMIQEIVAGLDGFSPTLSVQNQGLFALGYYHQRKDLFTKREAAGTESATPTEPEPAVVGGEEN